MAEIEKISIALPGEMIALIKTAVESGEYATTSEVIRDALRDWKRRRKLEEIELEELREAVRPALESLNRGERIPAEEVFDRLEKKYLAMIDAQKSQ